MKILVSIIVLLIPIFRLYAQGYILPAGVINVGFWGGVGYEIDVRQNSTNASFVDYTGFFLNPVGKTTPALSYSNTFSFGVIVDEGVRVFRVNSNAAISLDPILSQSWIELGSTPTNIFPNGVPFYLALYTGYNPFAITNINGNNTSYYTGIYNPAVFGWAKLVNNFGVIQLLDSAMEYGGAGIFAGTQNIIPVPEPGEIALAALGAALLGCRFRLGGFNSRLSSSTPDKSC